MLEFGSPWRSHPDDQMTTVGKSGGVRHTQYNRYTEMLSDSWRRSCSKGGVKEVFMKHNGVVVKAALYLRMQGTVGHEPRDGITL